MTPRIPRRNAVALLASLPAVVVLALVVLGGCGGGAPPAEEGDSISLLSLTRQMKVVDQDIVLELVSDAAVDRAERVLRISPRIQLEDGWTAAGSGGRWSLGPTSTVSVTLDRPRPRTLSVRVRSLRDPHQAHTQRMTVAWNQTRCATVTVPTKATTLKVDVPIQLQRPGANTLTFSYSWVATPASLGINPDQRNLAVSFDWVAVHTETPSGGTAARLRHLVQSLRRGRTSGPLGGSVRLDPDQEVIRFTQPAELVLAGRVPANVRSLALSVGGARPDDGARVTMTLTELDGTRQELLSAGADGSEREIRLERWQGQHVVLEIAGELGPGGSPLELRRPRLLLEPKVAGRRPSPPAGPSRQPDIVMLLLDAARADHFSCYGYARPTTPNIDRLARGSLRFEQAYALAPYTLASVPTMLTGLSFLEHGVVDHSGRLSGAARTLAERLAAAGYQTAAFTPSPNDSTVTGCDQGYESYHEVWRGVPPPQAIDPHRLTRLAIDWLRGSRDPHRPLHLFVHYVPPHNPYDPPPRFDVFTDPGYRGTLDGTADSLSAISRGLVQFSAADLDHIRDLYDGNLLRVDDAVEQLLSELERSPRWRNTVVLVTADHGDAFLEHGHMGHNSTVYDEMLHVPFILRLPAAMAAPDVDQTQLVTLADIVPTLCRLAGAPVAPGLDGRDLLATEAGPKDRFFVARTAGPRHDLALHSRGLAAIIGPGGRDELYDLASDPEERHNLAGLRPGLFAGLVRLLEERVSAASPLDTEAGELKQEEWEMLHALGYVE